MQFDAPLDVSTVTDQTVFVVNVTADDPLRRGQANPRFGERLPLDLGRGELAQAGGGGLRSTQTVNRRLDPGLVGLAQSQALVKG